MKYLIDSNILLWFFEKNPKLPSDFREIILNDDNSIIVSIATLWEISLKYKLQKLRLPVPLPLFIDEIEKQYEFQILPVFTSHIVMQTTLPLHHRDPFDRLIYAQSVVEAFQFLYTDSIFDVYKTERV